MPTSLTKHIGQKEACQHYYGQRFEEMKKNTRKKNNRNSKRKSREKMRLDKDHDSEAQTDNFRNSNYSEETDNEGKFLFFDVIRREEILL